MSARYIDTVPVTLYAISKALAGRFVARTAFPPNAACDSSQAVFLRSESALRVSRPGGAGALPPTRAAQRLPVVLGSGACPRLAQGPAPILPSLFSFGSGRAGSNQIG